jgi:formate-dependent nitrite reductase membrane component NrfD
MMGFLAAEHFVRAPNWGWWILLYFFFAGIAGGSYVMGTLLRLWGTETDVPTARIAFVVSLVAIVICPIFLTVDLGQPTRFWHMLVDTGTGSLSFKYWSPMSVGAWGLLLFGLFAFVSAVEAALALRGTPLPFFSAPLATLWMVVGSILGLFIAAYTGVLLSVSNQPVWSDGWPLGGLFLASGLSGSAALLILLAGWRRDIRPSLERIDGADRLFLILEAALIVLFLITVAVAGTVAKLFSPVMVLLWLLVLAGLAAPFVLRRRAMAPALAPAAVLVGVLALRAVIIFGAQT